MKQKKKQKSDLPEGAITNYNELSKAIENGTLYQVYNTFFWESPSSSIDKIIQRVKVHEWDKEKGVLTGDVDGGAHYKLFPKLRGIGPDKTDRPSRFWFGNYWLAYAYVLRGKNNHD